MYFKRLNTGGLGVSDARTKNSADIERKRKVRPNRQTWLQPVSYEELISINRNWTTGGWAAAPLGAVGHTAIANTPGKRGDYGIEPCCLPQSIGETNVQQWTLVPEVVVVVVTVFDRGLLSKVTGYVRGRKDSIWK